MNKLYDCYASLFLELVGVKNDKGYLRLPATFITLLLICVAISLIRNAMHMAFRFPFFYCFDPDIMVFMSFWAIHLFLFPAMLLCVMLRFLGYKNITIEPIFALFFSLQIIHLIIPFFDWAGHKLGIPYFYVLGKQPIISEWYTNMLFFLSPGIALAWIVSIYLVIKILRQQFQIKWRSIALIATVILAIIFTPIYFVFPALNTIFNTIVGVWPINPDSIRSHFPPRLIFWGYSFYIILTSVLGGWYFMSKRESAHQPNNTLD